MPTFRNFVADVMSFGTAKAYDLTKFLTIQPEPSFSERKYLEYSERSDMAIENVHYQAKIQVRRSGD